MTDPHPDDAWARDPEIPLDTQPTDCGEVTPCMIFRLGSSLYALPTRFVDHVAIPEPAVPIPSSPEHFSGIVALRGRIITVVDIGRILGVEKPLSRTEEETSARRMLALDVGNVPFAIEVDAVVALHDVTDLTPREKAVPATRSPQFSDMEIGKGHFRFLNGVVTLLDVEALLRGLEGGEVV